MAENTFEKGLSTEFSPLKQVKGTYAYAKNVIRDNQGTIKSEPGTTQLHDFSTLPNPSGGNVTLIEPAIVGSVVVDDANYYFIKSLEGSTIVKIDTEVNIIMHTGTLFGSGSNSINEDLLNFSGLIDVVARKDYKGNTILYFTDGNNVPRRISTDEMITKTTFESKTKLFLNPSLPRIYNSTVIESGGIKTGLYKFAARLVSGTGNKTTFSQISDPIPIVNENKATGEIQYDGAEPQSVGGKSIKLNINNIDESYDEIEIAVITYLGEENTLSVKSLGTKVISGNSLTFTYYSDDQFEDTILLEELVTQAIEYETAKHILQKDNYLFLSNLKSKDLSFLDNEIQSVANAIQLHYKIKTESQDFNAVKYSAEIEDVNGVVTDWTTGGNYGAHSIRLKQSITTTFKNYNNPDFTQKYKGYQRDEVYSFALVPIFKGGIYGNAFHIPGDSSNISTVNSIGSENTSRLRAWQNLDGTLHHRMPSVEKEPVVDIKQNTYKADFRILGIEARNVVFSDNLKDKLEGYVIVRQRRVTSLDGIVMTQGLAINYFDSSNNTIVPAPQNGKTAFAIHDNPSNTLFTMGNKTIDSGISHDFAQNYFSFYSPDHIHNIMQEEHIGAINSLKQVSIRTLERIADNRKTNVNIANTPAFGVYYNDIEDSSTDSAVDQSQLHSTKDITFATSIPAFESSESTAITLPDGKILKSEGITKSLAVKLTTGRLEREYAKFTGTNGGLYSVLIYPLGTNGDYYVSNEKETTEIYNLYNLHSNTYGELADAEYVKIKEVYFDETSSTTIPFYGGDTFITRYSFCIGSALTRLTASQGKTNLFANIDTYIETRGNYAYRHFNTEIITGETTVPYAPKYLNLSERDSSASNILGVWDYGTALMSTSYNKHYNFENTINVYYPKEANFESVLNFPNRTIYSLKSAENERFDAFRTFLTNNFHDIPKETGEISNMFEYNNTLYLHTPHALWRTFVNERTFINTSSGDIVLGNGGLFPIPSENLFTQQGGYAGSGDKWGSTNTPYGRVFVDTHQRKVFQLVGKEELREISNPTMETYFKTNIEANKNQGTYVMGYDPLFKRFILSIDSEFSVSYDFELNSWTSFHSYPINIFSYKDDKLLGIFEAKLAEIGTGLPAQYFGQVYSSEIHLIVNENPLITKEFRNLKWIQKYKNNIFNKISIETENYNTGDIEPIIVTSFLDEQTFLSLGSQHVNQIGGEYRMTIPPDNTSSYNDDLFRPAIKGKYSIIKLEYNSSEPLELEHFNTEYIKVSE